MKMLNYTISLLTLLASFSVMAELTAAPGPGPAPAPSATPTDPIPVLPSIQIVQATTRNISKTFEVTNAENQVVEVRLIVDSADGEAPLNRDVAVTVQMRCKIAGKAAKFKTVFNNDGTCIFNSLAYNSITNGLVIQHTDPRMVKEAGQPDRGRLRCDRERKIEIPLVCGGG